MQIKGGDIFGGDNYVKPNLHPKSTIRFALFFPSPGIF